MSEEEVVELEASEETEEVVSEQEASPKKKGKKWPIIAGVVAVVLVAAGAGFWVWHEQPSFCNAICHTPMDEYYETYIQEPDTTGVDKWGNEVENTSAMLCVSHAVSTEDGGAGATCMSCHTPVISEQIAEGITWVTGSYEYPLEERSASDMTEVLGVDGDEFCLNESCHNITRDDLIEATSDLEFNPHVSEHGESECTDCHKAHRASVLTCTQCHTTVEVPDGWLTYSESEDLEDEQFS